jgi:hypothetical protein
VTVNLIKDNRIDPRVARCFPRVLVCTKVRRGCDNSYSSPKGREQMITIKQGNYELFSTRYFGILRDRRHDWRSANTSDIANWRGIANLAIH